MFTHTFLRKSIIFVCLIVANTNIKGQERFSVIFSEQPYFLNPALTSIYEENRYSFGFSNQGYGQPMLSSLYAQINFFNKELSGGIEAYAVRYKEGAMNHNLFSLQLSRFIHLHKKWSLSIGLAPDIHNYSISNNDIILESQLLNLEGIGTVFPSIWSIGLSCGIAFYSKEHSLGFSVQNIFNKTYYKNSPNNYKNPSQINYVFSAGSIFDLKPYNNYAAKTFLRPHIATIITNSEVSFYYGTFYGTQKNQFGMFFVSTANHVFLGISPALMTKLKGIKIMMSIKIFPNLPTYYVFGNEIITQGIW